MLFNFSLAEKIDTNNSLEDFRKTQKFIIFAFIYIDIVFFNILLDIEKSIYFYQNYYLCALGLLGLHGILLMNELFKKSLCIKILKDFYNIFSHNKIISYIVMFGLPVIYISFFD